MKRESNFELLRIICTIAVITIHVSANYKTAITDASILGYLYSEHIVTVLIYNTLSRFAVPCFIMLSGAFLLSDDRNANCKYFYRKSMKNIGIPTLLFSVFYFLFSEGMIGAKIVLKGEEVSNLLFPIRNVIIGSPYYHMWYLYTLLGLYLIIPIIIEFKNRVGEHAFRVVSFWSLPIAAISGWTSTFTINWGIGKAICYIGFLLAGYQLRMLYKDRPSNLKGLLMIFSGLLIESILIFVQYEHSMMGLAESDEKYSIVGNFNPLIVISSILIFAGFSRIRIKCNLDKISSHTFYIYLLHAGIWDVLSSVIKMFGIENDARIVIPTCILIVSVLSYVSAIIYKLLWSKIDKRYSISEKFQNAFRLN